MDTLKPKPTRCVINFYYNFHTPLNYMEGKRLVIPHPCSLNYEVLGVNLKTSNYLLPMVVVAVSGTHYAPHFITALNHFCPNLEEIVFDGMTFSVLEFFVYLSQTTISLPPGFLGGMGASTVYSYCRSELAFSSRANEFTFVKMLHTNKETYLLESDQKIPLSGLLRSTIDVSRKDFEALSHIEQLKLINRKANGNLTWYHSILGSSRSFESNQPQGFNHE